MHTLTQNHTHFSSMIQYLNEEVAEFFEWFYQALISYLPDDQNVDWWFVPRQALTGRILDVPDDDDTQSNFIKK